MYTAIHEREKKQQHTKGDAYLSGGHKGCLFPHTRKKALR